MRKWLLLALLLIFDLPVHASSGQDVGQDMIGLMHEDFPAKKAAALLPDGSPVSLLDWTFGTKLSNLKTVLDTGKVPLLQIDFFNGPGLRNTQLGAYEPMAGMTKERFSRAWESGGGKLRQHLAMRVKLYCDFMTRYPAVRLEMSPTLEHNLSKKAFREQMRVVRRNCPRAVVVNNPVAGVSTYGLGDKVERHGVHAQVSAPCSVSLDGDSAEDVDVEQFKRAFPQCENVYVWSRVFNGRLADGDFVDPRKRTAWPTADQLLALAAYVRPLPSAPSVACVPVAAPRLWKAFAEQKGIGDERADKPLWITPFSSMLVRVEAADGSEVGSLIFFGPFDGGGFRYYSGLGSNLTGTEMAALATRLSGSPYVVIREGQQCFGPIHPAFRYGTFRD